MPGTLFPVTSHTTRVSGLEECVWLKDQDLGRCVPLLVEWAWLYDRVHWIPRRLRTLMLGPCSAEVLSQCFWGASGESELLKAPLGRSNVEPGLGTIEMYKMSAPSKVFLNLT